MKTNEPFMPMAGYAIGPKRMRNSVCPHETPEEICPNAWAEEPIACRPTIYVQMRCLRRKIERDPDCPKHLQMAWGKGCMHHP